MVSHVSMLLFKMFRFQRKNSYDPTVAVHEHLRSIMWVIYDRIWPLNETHPLLSKSHPLILKWLTAPHSLEGHLKSSENVFLHRTEIPISSKPMGTADIIVLRVTHTFRNFFISYSLFSFWRKSIAKPPHTLLILLTVLTDNWRSASLSVTWQEHVFWQEPSDLTKRIEWRREERCQRNRMLAGKRKSEKGGIKFSRGKAHLKTSTLALQTQEKTKVSVSLMVSA